MWVSEDASLLEREAEFMGQQWDGGAWCRPSHILKIHFNIISHLYLGLPSYLFHSGLPIRTL